MTTFVLTQSYNVKVEYKSNPDSEGMHYIDGQKMMLGEVVRWCQDNIPREWQGSWDNSEYLVVINNKESAMAFKLKWFKNGKE